MSRAAPRTVLALGGNAITRKGRSGRYEELLENAHARTAIAAASACHTASTPD